MPSIRKKKSLFTLPALNSKVKSANVKFSEIFFGYLLGPLCAMLAGGIFTNFLNKYWTETLFAGQLTAGVNTFLTLLPLLSTILIIIGNLVAGQIIEHTKTKGGKARPWILLSAITLSVASVLMFICPFDNAIVKMVFTAVSYNLYYAVANPLYNTANSVMISVSTRNGKQRGLLASASNIAGLAVMGVGSMIFPTLLGFLVTESTPAGTARNYWLVLMAIVAVVTCIGSLLQYYFTRERVSEETAFGEKDKRGEPETDRRVTVKEQLKAAGSDRFWWIILIFYFLFQVSGSIKNMSMTYFTAKIVDNSFWGGNLDANTAAGMTQTLLAVLGAIPMAIAVVAVWPLSNKFGKQKITVVGMIIGVIGGILAGIGRDNVVVVAIGVAMKCLGSAPAGYLILAMIADSIDHIEAKSGVRTSGFTMSIYSSIMVASGPIAQGIFNGITVSGTNSIGITISYIWIETIAYGLCAVILLFFGVEKFIKVDQQTILARQKAQAEAVGLIWISPEERMRIEEEEAEKEAEDARIAELRKKCEKKGLDFDKEEAKYQKNHEAKLTKNWCKSVDECK